MTIDQAQLEEFLGQSNAIEGVFGQECLDAALAAWEYINSKEVMTVPEVLETHRILMQPRGAWEEDTIAAVGRAGIGALRKSGVRVGIHTMMHPLKIEEALDEWCLSMNIKVPPDMGGSESWSRQLHVEYETIHPFIDGNGRTGRIFMNWWRVRHNLPLLIIHTGEEQMEYYQWFNRQP